MSHQQDGREAESERRSPKLSLVRKGPAPRRMMRCPGVSEHCGVDASFSNPKLGPVFRTETKVVRVLGHKNDLLRC